MVQHGIHILYLKITGLVLTPCKKLLLSTGGLLPSETAFGTNEKENDYIKTIMIIIIIIIKTTVMSDD